MNTYLTNIIIVAVVAILCWAIGWQSFLLVHGTIFLIEFSRDLAVLRTAHI